MKKIIIVYFLCVISIFSKSIIEFVTGDYPPYAIEKSQRGIFIDILREAGNRMDAKISVEFYSWKKCEELLKKGDVLGVFPYKLTNERIKDFNFSVSVISSQGKFFYLKEQFRNPTWTDFNSLKKFKIGGTLGYWYEKEFFKNGIILNYSQNDEMTIKKLYTKKVDIVPIDELVGWTLIKRLYPNEYDKFDVMKKELNSDDLYIMISKKYPNSRTLEKELNSALETMKQDGTIENIIKNYK